MKLLKRKRKSAPLIDQRRLQRPDPQGRAHPLERLDGYLKVGRHQVEGWLQLHDALIIEALSERQHAQGWHGPTLEIGVYHGKSAILFELLRHEDEAIVALDIFPGETREAFEANLRRHAGAEHACRIVAGRAEDHDAAALTAPAGRFRLYHVDGNHGYQAALRDLRLAPDVLNPTGILIVDDVFVPSHADVTTALIDFLRREALVPFALSGHKAYLSAPDCAEDYRLALFRDLPALGWTSTVFDRAQILAVANHLK